MQSNTFDLFIIPGALPPVIHLAQYDNARTFEASLKNADGNAYMPPEGVTATFEGTNRLGGQYQIECEVDGANVTFTPDGNATNQWGRTAATITLRDGDDQITALNIIVDVQRAGVTNEEAAENPGFTDRIAQAILEYGARFGAVTRFYNAEISESGAISSTSLIPHDDLKLNDIILTKNNRLGYISSVSPLTVALFSGNFLTVGGTSDLTGVIACLQDILALLRLATYTDDQQPAVLLAQLEDDIAALTPATPIYQTGAVLHINGGVNASKSGDTLSIT